MAFVPFAVQAFVPFAVQAVHVVLDALRPNGAATLSLHMAQRKIKCYCCPTLASILTVCAGNIAVRVPQLNGKLLTCGYVCVCVCVP